MSVETEFRALLTGDATVQSLVGIKVRANRAEQADQPSYVIFRRTDTQRARTLDGTVVDERVVLEVECWATSKAKADEVADAVEAVLATADQEVQSRSEDYDGELDLALTMLTVSWWV